MALAFAYVPIAAGATADPPSKSVMHILPNAIIICALSVHAVSKFVGFSAPNTLWRKAILSLTLSNPQVSNV